MSERFQPVARVCRVAVLGIAVTVSPAWAAPPDTVTGLWSTDDGKGVVAIERCGDELCGRIVGIDRAPDAPAPKDVHGISECGLGIISKERPTDDGSWLGEILDPRTGRTYGARLRIDEDGNLRLRAFLAISLLGETRIWRPFTGQLADSCRLK